MLVCFAILAVAAYVDMRILEVPDWLNYSGIGIGIGIHLIFSAQLWSWKPIVSSLAGFAIGFAIACIMYYTGQWGGGDAKLLMALGALIGFQPDKLAFGASYLVNLLIVGGAWGLLWSTGLAIGNAKRFWKTFMALRHKPGYARLRIMSLITAAVLIIASFVMVEFQLELVGLALLSYVLCYLTIFVKSIELCCMHKWVTPDKLTEGDWLMHAIKVGKNQVIPGKLGLEKKQVNLIKKLYAQKKIDKVLVKYGIPFAPAFLIAFIFTVSLGNIILSIVF